MKTRRENERLESNSLQEKLNLFCVPPIFTGFEGVENDDGYFITNLKDGSVFKWISIDQLEDNGIYYGDTEFNKEGRQSSEGSFINYFKEKGLNKRGYYETDDARFKKCISRWHGFYISISRARKDAIGRVVFGKKGELVDFITSEEARFEAEMYAKQFSKNEEFISCIPCGAAMDYFYEYLFEEFRRDVKSYHKDGVCGFIDIFYGGEYTSELYKTPLVTVVRNSESKGLYLADNEIGKTDINASFPLGHRDLCYAKRRCYGDSYRVILLPQKELIS